VAAEGGWDLHIGGNGGSKVYVGHKIAQVGTDEEVIRIADRFYEYYRQHGRYGERTAHFIERLGLQTVTDAILNGAEAEMQALEDRLQEVRDNYRDPWTLPIDVNDVAAETVTDDDGREFVTVADTEAVPEGVSRLFTVKGTDVAVFHTRDGRWVAVDGLCPHEAGPMVDSIYGDGRLACPLHSYTFDVSTGVCDNPEIDPVGIHDIRIRDRRIEVALRERSRPACSSTGGCGGCSAARH
jgi:nitrite reductase/ring-hydroxylating ferredoxin subunit